MNYIKKFMEDNGIKEGEIFDMIDEKGKKVDDCQIKDNTLYRGKKPCFPLPYISLICLLNGEYKIKKILKPFYPKKGEWYWCYGVKSKCAINTFNDLQLTDTFLINNGFAFRTKEEAEENKQFVIDFYNEELAKHNKLVESEE